MSRNYLKIFYLIWGIAGFIFFTWTGSIMRYDYPNKEDLEMGFRVMLRSRHIFLLLIALLEIGIGVYIRQSANKVILAIQLLATALIVSAHTLFIYGFFNEVAVETIPATPAIHWAAYLAVAGIVFHLTTIFHKEI